MADEYDAVVIGAGIDGYTLDLGYHALACGGKGYWEGSPATSASRLG